MINPDKWYTIAELLELGKQGLIPVKSRYSLMRIINSGEIKPYIKGETYMLLGKDVTDYFSKSRRVVTNGN